MQVEPQTPQLAPLDAGSHTNDALVLWPSRNTNPSIQCSVRFLDELRELAAAGFRRYPWGGVELGGILLGRFEADYTVIMGFRAFDCEHEYGPAFELTARDSEAFGALKASIPAVGDPADTVPVGWFHTVSKRELTLGEPDRQLHRTFFPEPRSVALVLRRSKAEPPEIGFFVTSKGGELEAHSPAEALTPETCRRARPIVVRAAVSPAVSRGVSPGVSMEKQTAAAASTPEPSAPAALEAAPGDPLPAPVDRETTPASHAPEQPPPGVPIEETPVATPIEAAPELVSSDPEPVPVEADAAVEPPVQLAPVPETQAAAPQELPASPPPAEPRSRPAPAPYWTGETPAVAPTPAAEPTGLDLPAPVAGSPYSSLGLPHDPFSPVPDVQFFCPFPEHREALANLLHRIQTRAGFVALIGAAGTGKSLVLECLVGLLKQRDVEFAYLYNSKITVAEFYELVAHDLDLKCATSKTSVLIALNEYLIQRFSEGLTTALIVDNAQKLSTDVLEEIELFGNLEARGGRLLQVVLAGQPDFESRIQTAQLRSLHQRILTRARITALSGSETPDYITRRLMIAGLPEQRIFSQDLMAEIHQHTRGIPRLINALCGRMMELCVARGSTAADREILESAAAEMALEKPTSSSQDPRPLYHR